MFGKKTDIYNIWTALCTEDIFDKYLCVHVGECLNVYSNIYSRGEQNKADGTTFLLFNWQPSCQSIHVTSN